MPLRCAEPADEGRRRGRLEVDVELGERDAHASASVSGGGAAGSAPDGEGGADLRGGALGRRLVARVHDRERAAARADLLPQPGDVDEPDGVVDRVVLAPAPAAQLEHGDAEVAHRDRAARARRSRGPPRARAAPAAGGGPGRRAGRPGRRARRTCARTAPPPRPRRAPRRPPRGRRPRPGRARRAAAASRASASVTSTSRGSAARGWVSTPSASRTSTALPGRPAEHLVHVGDQRVAGQPGAARDADDRARQLDARSRGRA